MLRQSYSNLLACLRHYWLRRRGLRAQLILLVLAALLPLVLFATGMILMVAREEHRTAERGMRDTVRALALAMDREVSEIHTALEILALSRLLTAGDLAGFYQQCRKPYGFFRTARGSRSVTSRGNSSSTHVCRMARLCLAEPI